MVLVHGRELTQRKHGTLRLVWSSNIWRAMRPVLTHFEKPSNRSVWRKYKKIVENLNRLWAIFDGFSMISLWFLYGFSMNMTWALRCHTMSYDVTWNHMMSYYASYFVLKEAPLDSNGWASQYVTEHVEVWRICHLRFFSVDTLIPKQYETQSENMWNIKQAQYKKAFSLELLSTVSCCTVAHIALSRSTSCGESSVSNDSKAWIMEWKSRRMAAASTAASSHMMAVDGICTDTELYRYTYCVTYFYIIASIPQR